MKTSNKLLLSALFIFVISVTVYNYALKAEYLTGNYKKPYRDYNKVDINGFTEVEINGCNLVNVEFKQGEFDVRNSKRNQDSLRFTKVGNRLIVNVELFKVPSNTVTVTKNGTTTVYESPENRYNTVVITLPKLLLLKTSDNVLVNGKVYDNTAFERYSSGSYHRGMYFGNFKLDSLTLVENSSSQITLQETQIKALKVIAGNLSAISIGNGNMIESANLQINAGAEMTLEDITFPKLTYQISDSAKVSLYKKSLSQFIKKQ